jgi:hypothetical protein
MKVRARVSFHLQAFGLLRRQVYREWQASVAQVWMPMSRFGWQNETYA